MGLSTGIHGDGGSLVDHASDFTSREEQFPLPALSTLPRRLIAHEQQSPYRLGLLRVRGRCLPRLDYRVSLFRAGNKISMDATQEKLGGQKGKVEIHSVRTMSHYGGWG